MGSKKSYIGQPYYGSARSVRLYPTLKKAEKSLIRKGTSGKIVQIGKGKIFAIKEKRKKFFSK